MISGLRGASRVQSVFVGVAVFLHIQQYSHYAVSPGIHFGQLHSILIGGVHLSLSLGQLHFILISGVHLSFSLPLSLSPLRSSGMSVMIKLLAVMVYEEKRPGYNA